MALASAVCAPSFFGRGIVAIAQGGGKFVVTIGADVGEIGEVGALHEERQEFVLVDDFLARRVDQKTPGRMSSTISRLTKPRVRGVAGV